MTALLPTSTSKPVAFPGAILMLVGGWLLWWGITGLFPDVKGKIQGAPK